VSDFKAEATLREVSIVATPVKDDDDLDALFGDVVLEEKAIAKVTNKITNKITNMFLDKLDVDDFAVEAFGDDGLADGNLQEKQLQQELDALQSQHEFECEYVDQLEQEIISITNDRDRQVQELTAKLEQLQDKLQNPLQNQADTQPANPHATDDRDLSDRLAVHVLQLEEEFKHRLAIALEIESQKITSHYLQEIVGKDETIHQLQEKNTALEISQQTLTEELENTHSLLQECTKTIEIAQSKLSEVTTHRDQIEEELIQHLSNQAKLHQSLRGLENEYVSDLTRVQDSEQQIEELQEQVLRQASKAAEYEAAIQHWKEQSVRHQHHALQLSAALDRLLVEKPVRHLTENSVQSSGSAHGGGASEQEYLSRRSPESTPEAPRSEAPRFEVSNKPMPVRSLRPKSNIDLPSFLVRHR
jgi:septal ring factor EnvC (AmiA/AmiB activator)